MRRSTTAAAEIPEVSMAESVCGLALMLTAFAISANVWFGFLTLAMMP